MGQKKNSMRPSNPKDLLKGISDLFVSHNPDFGYDSPITYSPRNRAGWEMICKGILNPFAPSSSSFLHELKMNAQRLRRLRRLRTIEKD